MHVVFGILGFAQETIESDQSARAGCENSGQASCGIAVSRNMGSKRRVLVEEVVTKCVGRLKRPLPSQPQKSLRIPWNIGRTSTSNPAWPAPLSGFDPPSAGRRRPKSYSGCWEARAGA